jgi:hypothetical protein
LINLPIFEKMRVSENLLKWAMRLYPPLFFQRIWVRRFHQGFRGVDVKLAHSILNRNYNGSIFGGSIFSATDPFYALLFDQILRREGFKTLVWLKSAEISYLKPARGHLYFSIIISDAEIARAREKLVNEGKYIESFTFELRDKTGLTHARVTNEVYIRNKSFSE